MPWQCYKGVIHYDGCKQTRPHWGQIDKNCVSLTGSEKLSGSGQIICGHQSFTSLYVAAHPLSAPLRASSIPLSPDLMIILSEGLWIESLFIFFYSFFSQFLKNACASLSYPTLSLLFSNSSFHFDQIKLIESILGQNFLTLGISSWPTVFPYEFCIQVLIEFLSLS